MATEPGFLPEDVGLVGVFLTVRVKKSRRKSWERQQMDTVERIKRAVEKGGRLKPTDKSLVLGTISLFDPTRREVP